MGMQAVCSQQCNYSVLILTVDAPSIHLLNISTKKNHNI